MATLFILEFYGDEEKKVGHRCTQMHADKGQKGIKSNSTVMSNYSTSRPFPICAHPRASVANNSLIASN